MKNNSICRNSLTILLVCVALIPKAQTSKANWFVEGNLGNLMYNQNRNTGANIVKTVGNDFRFSLNPRAAYFISDRLALGSTLGYGYSIGNNKWYYENNKLGGNNKYRFQSISLVPFVRYYLNEPKNKWQYYAQVGAGFAYGKQTSTGTNYNESGFFNNRYENSATTQIYLGEAHVGLHYFITPQLALNSSIGANFANSKQRVTNFDVSLNAPSSSPYQNSYDTNSLNFIWNFGFTYFIPTGKK